MKSLSMRRGGSRGGGSSVDLFDACWGVFVGVFSSVTSSVVVFCVVGCSLIKSPGDKLSVDDDSLKGLFVGRFSIVFVGVDEVCNGVLSVVCCLSLMRKFVSLLLLVVGFDGGCCGASSVADVDVFDAVGGDVVHWFA